MVNSNARCITPKYLIISINGHKKPQKAYHIFSSTSQKLKTGFDV